MIINAIGMVIVACTIPVLVGIIAYKVFVKKKPIDTRDSYTPFDYITGQTSQEFQEEEIQEEEASGDDKDR